MHSLLLRQLRKAGLNYESLPEDTGAWQAFLQRIDLSYENAEKDRKLYETGQVKPITQNNHSSRSISLNQSSLQLQTIMDAMPDGLCAFGTDKKLVFANPVARFILNLDEQVLYITDILKYFELHESKDLDKLIDPEKLLAKLQAGQRFNDSHALIKRGSREFPVACELNPITKEGQIVGFVMIFVDISEIRKAEKNLIAAKEAAERASKAKSQFLSSMSHELRTPMNAILGYSELLKEDLSEPVDSFDQDYVEDMQQYVGNILQAGWHLLELINKVLDLSRIEAGKLEVNIEKVELVDLIKECLSIAQPLAEKRNITVENTTSSLPPQYALVDRARLKQVIINLLSNAVKYNKENGKITIEIKQSNPEFLCFSVTDTGIGLSTEQQAKIFEPFTRMSGVNLIEGTGIGLTITKRLLEIMDAKIWVESTEGQGTTFFVDLPTGVVAQDTQDIDDSKYILLYIEDSRTNVSLVSQILKSRPDIALISAHTGEMGLEMAQLHHPHVILLDINLPGMDGFEVSQRLKASDVTKNIPIIALTAMDNAKSTERGKAAGFLTYIVKPLDIKEFLKAIDMALAVEQP
ncbi:ATP-binding protein [Candidatus Albibeggiatoa sp. nov. NOAA]|uniref:ATP-binding response regulator n=1 Tax=Candidatus Albibeggiatoa sp. nov. NOAA TaxID=3162724 RepID=UPI00330477DE|nr:ATP-binding protein [Thiotrichaceae bacterium]